MLLDMKYFFYYDFYFTKENNFFFFFFFFFDIFKIKVRLYTNFREMKVILTDFIFNEIPQTEHLFSENRSIFFLFIQFFSI